MEEKNLEFTYKEARHYIENAALIVSANGMPPEEQGIVMGLSGIRECLERLGNPQDELRIIHIAGTNGKGSTAAFISTILRKAGYTVGRYTSPSVYGYGEKIQCLRPGRREIENISKREVVKAVEFISVIIREMVAEGHPHLTPFEIETIMAFLTFKEWKCDFVVLEAGMGGRDDATNVVRKVECSVLTSIGLDHMGFLGNDLESVAYHKAGIIKEHTPVVTTNQDKKVIEVIRETCKQEKSPLLEVDVHKVKVKRRDLEGTWFCHPCDTCYEIRLLGLHQVENAVLALEAISILQRKGYQIREGAVKDGLRETVWCGRLEVISKNPWILVDGAHNLAAVKELKENLLHYFKGEKKIGIMGVFADKDHRSILNELQGVFHEIYTITPSSKRALHANRLAEEAKGYEIPSEPFKGIGEAIRKAVKEGEVIVVFGSLSMVKETMCTIADPSIFRL